jgi:hypothetical protein
MANISTPPLIKSTSIIHSIAHLRASFAQATRTACSVSLNTSSL